MPTTERGSWGYGSERPRNQVWLTEQAVIHMTDGKERKARAVVFEPKCKTLVDMSVSERTEIANQYGAVIREPGWRFEWGLV